MNLPTWLRSAARQLCLVILTSLAHADGELQADDRLVTIKGKEHHGQVVFENKERLVLRTKTRLTHFEQAELKSVDAVLREQPKALKKLLKIKSDDVEGLLDPGARLLAAEMLGSNLPYEANLVYWRVILQDPNNALANEALGHRLVAGKWKLRAGSKWLRLDKLHEYHEEWNNGWEFETTHFLLRSNLPLAQVLQSAFDLEYT